MRRNAKKRKERDTSDTKKEYKMSLTIGDKVNWYTTPRGGYGYPANLAAIYLGPTKSGRSKIRVLNTYSGQIELRHVQTDRLTLRTNHVGILDTEEQP